MDFAQGNEIIEKLEERYQNDNRYYRVRYHIAFPESNNSKMEVVSMDCFDIGDEEFLNPHHEGKVIYLMNSKCCLMMLFMVFCLKMKDLILIIGLKAKMRRKNYKH